MVPAVLLEVEHYWFQIVKRYKVKLANQKLRHLRPVVQLAKEQWLLNLQPYHEEVVRVSRRHQPKVHQLMLH